MLSHARKSKRLVVNLAGNDPGKAQKEYKKERKMGGRRSRGNLAKTSGAQRGALVWFGPDQRHEEARGNTKRGSRRSGVHAARRTLVPFRSTRTMRLCPMLAPLSTVVQTGAPAAPSVVCATATVKDRTRCPRVRSSLRTTRATRALARGTTMLAPAPAAVCTGGAGVACATSPARFARP